MPLARPGCRCRSRANPAGSCLAAGALPTSISHYPDELASLSAALEWAEPGDLVLVMALANSVGYEFHWKNWFSLFDDNLIVVLKKPATSAAAQRRSVLTAA